MSSRMFNGAGVLAAVLGVLVLVLIFVFVGTVDLVYMNNGREVYRQNGVGVFADVDDPNEKMHEEFRTEGETIEFTYTIGEDQKDFDPEDPKNLKADIVKTLLTNLFTFKWDELDNDIVFEAK